MQRMFSEQTDWYTPWMGRVLPNVVSIVEIDPARTVFTRFIPVESSEEAMGSWRRYYERWPTMTLEQLDPELIDLVPGLARFVPPAQLLDKRVMSPWHSDLHARLQSAATNTLIVTGSETEVCVLATVMGGIDLGYRIVLVTDAICSGADETHDAMKRIYQSRFGMQVETVTTAELMAARIDGALQ
jgi:nicotinamidase-related amidase